MDELLICKTVSGRLPVIIGVPEGEVVGQVLFIIINNFYSEVDNCSNINLFANDKNILVSQINYYGYI